MSRIWGTHAIVLAVVLGASLAYLAGVAPNFTMALEFLWIPIAALYMAVSTALVALFQPGRGGVVVAHAIALILVALATPFFVSVH